MIVFGGELERIGMEQLWHLPIHLGAAGYL
jgi:hypothetical protein